MLSSFSKQIILLAIITIAGIVIITYYPPTSHQYIPCIFNVVTGLHCAGCGTTRAIYSLLQGNIFEASRNNLPLFIWGPYCIYMLFKKYCLNILICHIQYGNQAKRQLMF